MADKRMFSKNIVCSDMFYKLPATSRDLYFQLNMEADDEGFVSNVSSIMKKIDSKPTDLGQLVKKGLIIRFKSGILVIVHWYINNLIRSDRKKPTMYKQEKSKLSLCSNGFYIIKEEIKKEEMTTKVVDKVTTKSQPSCTHSDNPISIDKSSIVENSIVENSVDKSSIVKTSHTREVSSVPVKIDEDFVDEIIKIIEEKIPVPLGAFVTQFKYKIDTLMTKHNLKDISDWITLYNGSLNTIKMDGNLINIYGDLFNSVISKVENMEEQL